MLAVPALSVHGLNLVNKMKHFKDPTTNMLFAYALDGSQDAYILPNLVAITDDEADEIRSALIQPNADPKFVGVEFDGVMCSTTRDDQDGLTAVMMAYNMQSTAFPATKFYFANGNSLVLTKDNLQAFAAVWMPFRQSFFVPD